jgi:hypothetical protein
MGAPIRQISVAFKRTSRSLRLSRIASGYRANAADVKGAAIFGGLHAYSLAIATTRPTPGLGERVNVVLPQLRPGEMFAGIRTALEFACDMATRASRGLRVISLGNKASAKTRRLIEVYVADEFGYSGQVTMVSADHVTGMEFGETDLWVATHWSTAHSLDVACRLGIVAKCNVIYLIQDYEPGFHAWSTDYAIARSTYHAGFRQVVNSSLLRQYLKEAEGIFVEDRFVFGPSLDSSRLKAAAEQRRPSSVPRILFYGRPSKPRNLFHIGIAALSLVAHELEARGEGATFISAGEAHTDHQLSPKHKLVSRGKLSWDEYFGQLSNSDIVLSLQHSPHPSHPPLDAISSGAFAVTNEMGGTRQDLHRRLLVAAPEPAALAAQVLLAIEKWANGQSGTFDGEVANRLGGSISLAASNVLADLGVLGSDHGTPTSSPSERGLIENIDR